MRWFWQKAAELPAPQRLTELDPVTLPIPAGCQHPVVFWYSPKNWKEQQEDREYGSRYACARCDLEWREYPPWSKYVKP